MCIGKGGKATFEFIKGVNDMNCKKCGKKISIFKESCFYEEINGVFCYVCESCHTSCNKQRDDTLQQLNVPNNVVSGETIIRLKNDISDKYAKGGTAYVLKLIANIILLAFCIGGGALGCVLGPELCGYSYFRCDPILYVLAFAVGALIGAIVGFLISLFIRYLAELGENTKKAANAAIKQAQQFSENTQQESVRGLLELKELLDKNIITQEEFDKKKKQILGL